MNKYYSSDFYFHNKDKHLSIFVKSRFLYKRTNCIIFINAHTNFYLMKTKTFLQIFTAIVLVSFIFMWSCKKTTSLTTPINPGGPNQSPPVEMVSATVTGRVIDKNKQPVSGVAISTSSASTTTDVNGQFIFTNIQLDKNAGYVMAKKTGFFNGSKTFELTAGSSNYVEIELITKSRSGQFDASAGGIVTISNGGSINFPGNSITDLLTGSAYSGTVTVSAFFIDPSAANFGSIMPGELLGIAKDSSEKSLQSFGMMATELTGSSGQLLQISSGKTATITFPVPSKLVSTAPAKIPLWYFDEVKGLWREQDSATLQGTNYTANVSHFSFWNCDAGFPTINFNSLIEDQNNNPLSGLKVVIEDPSDSINISSYGYTNASGNVNGKIPANKNLKILIYDRCGDLIYTKNFSSANADLNLGTINTSVQTIPITFSGTVKNCSGNAVINGTVSIFLDNVFTFSNINNGNFSITINRCYSTAVIAQITATDFTTTLNDTLSVNVSNANIDSLQFKSCSLTDQYINYSIGSVNYSYAFPSDSASIGIYSGFSWQLYDNYDAFNYSIFQIKSWKAMLSNPFTLYITDTTINTTIEGYLGQPLGLPGDDWGQDIKVTLTRFGPINNYITGTFSGNISDTSYSGTVPVTIVPTQGTFNVKRTY
jgi:hypothetical protein